MVTSGSDRWTQLDKGPERKSEEFYRRPDTKDRRFGLISVCIITFCVLNKPHTLVPGVLIISRPGCQEILTDGQLGQNTANAPQDQTKTDSEP